MEPHTYTLPELGIFVGVVITSITGSIVAILTAWRTGSRVEKVAGKVDIIHELTNSNYSRQEGIITNLAAEVKALTAQLAEQEKQRAVLAAETKNLPLAVNVPTVLPTSGEVTGVIIKP